MQSASLAAKLGRGDLVGYNPPPVQDPYTNSQVIAGSQAGGGGGTVDTGRTAAAFVGVLVIAGVAFYLWTRNYQA
jgi:hypothetical protein